jgi:hypothetical protein
VRRRTNWRNSLRRFVVIHEWSRAERARERLASPFGVASGLKALQRLLKAERLFSD